MNTREKVLQAFEELKELSREASRNALLQANELDQSSLEGKARAFSEAAVLLRDIFRPTATPEPGSFDVNTPVSYRIGSDKYAYAIVGIYQNGRVIKAKGKVAIAVQTFTRRKSGRYLLRGKQYGHLVFGESETDLSREF